MVCTCSDSISSTDQHLHHKAVLMVVDGLTHEREAEDYRSALEPKGIQLMVLNIEVRGKPYVRTWKYVCSGVCAHMMLHSFVHQCSGAATGWNAGWWTRKNALN